MLFRSIKYQTVNCGSTSHEFEALMNGDADFICVKLGDCEDYLQDSQKIRMLAIFDKQRDSRYPDLPTMKELGIYVLPGGP